MDGGSVSEAGAEIREAIDRQHGWSVKGSLQHIPAEMWSQLFFQSPLRGQFEVISEHSTHGHGEVSIAWGMHAAQPRYDAKAVRVTKVMHGRRTSTAKSNYRRGT